MTLDEEILALERRIAEGDLLAWPELDAVLERAGRQPRRVWFIFQCGGQYSDSWERTVEPFHTTKTGAKKHLAELAATEKHRHWRMRSLAAVGLDGFDDEAYEGDDYGGMEIMWSELVP